MKVVICTMFSQSHIEMANMCLENMRAYASRHNYDVHEIRIEDNKYAYEKHYDFQALFEQGYDLIYYCDCDTLITNHTYRIEDFIDDEHDLFITMDATELNGGSIVLRNSDWGRGINLHIIAEKDNWGNEQNAINHYWDKPEWGGRVKVLPQTLLNAYDHSLYPELLDRVGCPELGDWNEKSFLIHFPALNPNDKLAMMQEYKDKITYE